MQAVSINTFSATEIPGAASVNAIMNQKHYK